jgi:hypothetical protein
VAGYTAGAWSCVGGSQSGANISLALGESATCTIINEDQPPSLTLIKVVENNNGGEALESQWTLSAAGPTPLSGPGPTVSSDSSFTQGTYNLSENGPAGYAPGPWECAGGTQNGNQITVALGESATCTIINRDIPPQLILTKVVINDDGGTAVETDFTLSATGPTSISGAGGVTSDDTFSVGTYDLSETNVAGYDASAWSCVGGTQNDAQITLGLAESATCTITNNDIPPTLKLVKVVDNGAKLDGAVPDDWTLSAAAVAPNDDRNFSNAGGTGAFTTVFANAGYELSESTVAGYQVKTDWSCDGGTQSGSTITLGLDDDVTCTITNIALGEAKIIKLTQGLPNEAPNPATQNWTFTLQDCGDDLLVPCDKNSTVMATITSPPSMVDFGVYLVPYELDPDQRYRLCEVMVPTGWTLDWMGDANDDGTPDTSISFIPAVNDDPVSVPPGWSQNFDPMYQEPPAIWSNEERCVNFVANGGAMEVFQVDNRFPGGRPSTIGYWKNWDSCSGGGQVYNAIENGGETPAERLGSGNALLDDVLQAPGITIGVLTMVADNDVFDCDEGTQDAVNILDKRDIDSDKKKASDPAYGLAAQLLAALANEAAGAGVCPEAGNAITAAQELLVGIEFDGTAGYFVKKVDEINGFTKQEANTLAGILDSYNNGTLCPE